MPWVATGSLVGATYAPYEYATVEQSNRALESRQKQELAANKVTGRPVTSLATLRIKEAEGKVPEQEAADMRLPGDIVALRRHACSIDHERVG
jgi:hypothetical protein